MGRRRSVSAGMAVLAVVLAAAPASAAPRYAAPDGQPSLTCPASAPCSLAQAVESASALDNEVVVTPGDYDLTEGTLVVSTATLNVHGVAGQPRPTIHGGPPGPLVNVTASTATLRHLA